jgi:hypothetical protein
MSESLIKLKHPPIVEAVLDIECDLPANFKLASVETRARKAFVSSYPKFRQQYVQEHRFEANVDQPPKVSFGNIGVQCLQFLKTDEKQLVQIRSTGFSFNRLSPYTSLDNYLPQIKKAWTEYIKLVSPLQVKLIRLRYINRFLLPVENSRLPLEEYLKNGPRSADERLGLTGFLNQYSAIESESGNQVVSVLTAQQLESDKLPIIFDNITLAVKIFKPEDWIGIRSKVLELRRLKNLLFRETLTEKCMNLFQPY